MRTVDIDNRRYRRIPARVPAQLHGGRPPSELPAMVMDISTAGAAFELLESEPRPQVGEAVGIRIPLRNGLAPFQTEGIVRHLTETSGATPPGRCTRVGVQFRDALLLSELPAPSA